MHARVEKSSAMVAVVLSSYNSRYSGGGNRRISIWGQPRQKLARSYLKNKIGIVDHTCNPRESRDRGQQIMIQADSSKSQDCLWEKNED
jgi:hypothetical protein